MGIKKGIEIDTMFFIYWQGNMLDVLTIEASKGYKNRKQIQNNQKSWIYMHN